MTILTVVQDVAMAVGIAKPSAVFGSNDRVWDEMKVVANEAARVIFKAYDWQKLTTLHTINGTGLASSFALPDDFGRMLRTASIWSSRDQWQTTHIVDLNEWLELTERDFASPFGMWTIYGGELHFQPKPFASEKLKFFYMSNKLVMGPVEQPDLKSRFTSDGDSFRLSERILRLCIIYLWKQLKGVDFAAELADYEQAIEQQMIEDMGSLPVLSGNTNARRSSNVWPGRVSG